MKKLILILPFLFGFISEPDSEVPIHLDWKIYDAQPYARFEKSEWDTFSDYEKSNAFYQTYFVTESGSRNNNGLSEGNAWSFTHAVETAIAGDLVNVKAGSYGNNKAIFSNAGTSGNPVKFVGYDNTPGDIVSTQYSTYVNHSGADPNSWPVFDGGTDFTGEMFLVTAPWVHIENFQLVNGRGAVGSYASATDLHLKNVVGIENGDQTEGETTGGSAGKGRGFIIRGDRSVLENCTQEDNTSQAFNSAGADDFVWKYCRAISDHNPNPTGYYFLFSGGSRNGVAEHCEVIRDPGNVHPGHGFVMKNDVQNCTFRNGYVEYAAVQVIFKNVENNIFEDITIQGFRNDPESSSVITWSNGAHNNTFRRILVRDSDVGMRINTWDDGEDGTGASNDPNIDKKGGGDFNTLEDCIFTNIGTVIQHTWASNDGPAFSEGNEFRNITIYDANIFLSTNFDASDYVFENIGLSGIASSNAITASTAGSNNGAFNNFSYTNCLYFNSSDSTWPSGWSSSTDPLFDNAGGDEIADYVVQPGSPWIGAGTSGQDVGYRHQGGGTPPTQQTKKDPFFGFLGNF